MTSTTKIASWNVNSINVRKQQLQDWIQINQPEVFAIQETKTTDDKFPVELSDELSYHCYFHGQKSYNGVAFFTKEDLSKTIEHDVLKIKDEQARTISLVYKDILIVNVYVPNGSTLESDKYQYKLRFLDALKSYLERQQQSYKNIIVLGDFNIAPEDIDCHDPEKWHNSTLTCPEIISSLNKIQSLGFVDSFRHLNPNSNDYSWWDYRQAAFRRGMGLRIDLILTSDNLTSSLSASSIDKTTRSLERPSDHAPVILEINQLL